MPIRLTKQDVARRQLVTAIRLFFEGGDPVSVYSLAANAWEITDALCVNTEVMSLSKETRQHLSTGRDLRRDYINSPCRNYFKHADRDVDATLDFTAEIVDSLIYLAVEDYLRLFKKSPIELQVFQLWYCALNIQKLSSDSLEDIREAIESGFPNIRRLDRSQQIMLGSKVLNESLQDTDLLNDKRTESEF